MKPFLISILLLFIVISVLCTLNTEPDWKIAENPIVTEFFRTVTDADNGTITLNINVSNGNDLKIILKVKKNNKTIATAEGVNGQDISVKIENPLLWSPENVFRANTNTKLSKPAKTN